MAVVKHYLKWPAALLLAVFVLSGCSREPEVIGFNGMTMGTTYSIRWVDTDESRIETLRPLVDNLLKEVNQQMSTYIEDSELSRFNALPAGGSLEVSPQLADVVTQALRISKLSDGAFDVTVGPLVNLWGFGPDGRIIKAPSDEKIEGLRAEVGYQNISVEGNALSKSGHQYVDLSAIAKGYGVDEVAALLEQQGIKDYLVEIGGELRASGLKPGKEDWRIAIESPVAGERDVERVVSVSDTGIATSGDYRNYFEENGQRFSHTIDPRTGRPITHKLASVTVLRPNCYEADALATTLMVLGDEAGPAFAEKHGIAAFFIIKQGESFVERSTPEFDSFLQEVN
ncbi:FAD:protein FMN transferase [Marinobacterium lutimaris]|uniref:FAD:protein FMN transferase n=1 Tax=Marinobacterium lutimaris TaxID=568106 RepID=A0A1H5WJY1_9GAMM|nr:FAD:protein FMN transferase [Marinobacterium lutimaris]SEF99949.1 thiamine biosynthesis lipoprotein [Marinobacterium lutimaris]